MAFCEENGAESVADVVEADFIDAFVDACALKKIPQKKLRDALEGMRAGRDGTAVSTKELTAAGHKVTTTATGTHATAAPPVEPPADENARREMALQRRKAAAELHGPFDLGPTRHQRQFLYAVEELDQRGRSQSGQVVFVKG